MRHFRALESGFDHGSNRRAGSEFGNLRDQAQPRALADRHFAGVRLHAAVKNFQQCRLARTVRADQTDAFAFGNREGNVLKERLGAISLGKSLCSNNRRQMIRFSPAISLA